MHHSSLPRGDQVESDGGAATITESRSHRPALVVALAGGGYFRAWRRRRGCVPVHSLSRALLFATEPRDAIDRVVAKLRRAGIEASVVQVEIRIGEAAAK